MDCCSVIMDMKSMCQNFNCKFEETETGFRIDVSPKDPKKAEALKSLLKACRELCDCKC